MRPGIFLYRSVAMWYIQPSATCAFIFLTYIFQTSDISARIDAVLVLTREESRTACLKKRISRRLRIGTIVCLKLRLPPWSTFPVPERRAHLSRPVPPRPKLPPSLWSFRLLRSLRQSPSAVPVRRRIQLRHLRRPDVGRVPLRSLRMSRCRLSAVPARPRPLPSGFSFVFVPR